MAESERRGAIEAPHERPDNAAIPIVDRVDMGAVYRFNRGIGCKPVERLVQVHDQKMNALLASTGRGKPVDGPELDLFLQRNRQARVPQAHPHLAFNVDHDDLDRFCARLRAAGVPIVVAVNKIDKNGADPDRVRNELAKQEVIPEEWGGDYQVVNVSSHTGDGVDALLDAGPKGGRVLIDVRLSPQ